MSVFMLYNLHDYVGDLKLRDTSEVLFFGVLWLCKFMYHNLGWTLGKLMWNSNFDIGAALRE
jgi:hypothetical protein